MTAANPAAPRVYAIDLLKGIACLTILYAHATAPSLERLSLVEQVLFSSIFVAAPLFFFVSGMNVVTFLAKYEGRAGFRLNTFYLAAAALLFVLSFCYSVNRGSLRMPQIFQGIAMTIAATYILLRLRIPNWALAAISVGVFALWAPFWEAQLPLLEQMRQYGFRESVDPTNEWLAAIRPGARYLFVHFSLLPWVGYTLAGAATYRSLRDRPTGAKWWLLFYLAMLAVSVVTLLVPRWQAQPLLVNRYPEMLVRCSPFFYFQWMGLSGLIGLAMLRWYHGADRFTGAARRATALLEYLGQQSFLFLIWHWAFLSVLLIFGGALEKAPHLGQVHALVYLPWLLGTVGVIWTIRWADRLGQRWRQRPRFVWEAAAVLVLCTAPGIIGFFAKGFVPFPRMLFSFGGCLAFAYLYPELRLRLRRALTAAT